MVRPDPSVRLQALQAATPRALPQQRIGRRDGVQVEVDGRARVDFASADHLGLGQHFSVVNALQDAAAREGVGDRASAIAGGRHVLHEALEQEVADWLGYPRALLFESRAAAHLAVQRVLLGGDDDMCVQDTLNHRDLADATRLAGARLRRYPHLDTEGAMRQLRAHPDGVALLATEAVFSADGATAPLRSLALLARLQHALLLVDDTHGVGVVGEQGRGSVAAAGLGTAEVALQVLGLGDALGCSGALLVGTAPLLEPITTACVGGYGTSLPPAQAAAALETVRLARREDWRREKLTELIALFRGSARRHGLALSAAEMPLQPLPCDSAEQALAIALDVQQAGLWVAATPADAAPQLRITLSALHSAEQVLALVEALAIARDRTARTVAVPLSA